MNKREYLELVGGPISRMFKPNVISPTDPQAVNELHGMYYQSLKDYGADTVARGMALLIAEHKAAWWPTVAEIREFFARGYQEIRQEQARHAALAGPKTNWDSYPEIKARLIRKWHESHPEHAGLPERHQHHVEVFVKFHANLQAQAIARAGGSDKPIELTAEEYQTARERYESQESRGRGPLAGLADQLVAKVKPAYVKETPSALDLEAQRLADMTMSG